MTPAQAHCHCRRVLGRFPGNSGVLLQNGLICSYLLSELGERVAAQVGFRSCRHEPKHERVLSHRPPGLGPGEGQRALCFVSVIKAIGFRIPSLRPSLSNTHGHLDPEILLRAAGKERAVGLKEMSPGLALHCRGSRCHSSVTQKTSSSACVTMAFRSLKHNDCWLTSMHSGLIEPELI